MGRHKGRQRYKQIGVTEYVYLKARREYPHMSFTQILMYLLDRRHDRGRKF